MSKIDSVKKWKYQGVPITAKHSTTTEAKYSRGSHYKIIKGMFTYVLKDFGQFTRLEESGVHVLMRHYDI
jgi:hypothetical protein